jgi:4-hydroxyphenylacetate 3-monooxygenase
MGHIERIKIMKLLWDATGTEFGGRHALYELNYAGAPEDVRLQVLKGAEKGTILRDMEALVDTCMDDYDEKGWTGETWLGPIGSEPPLRSAAE